MAENSLNMLWFFLFLAVVLLAVVFFRRRKLRKRTASREQSEPRFSLGNNRELLDALFNNPFRMIGFLSPDGKLLDTNKTSMEFIGVEKETVLGKYFWDCPWWNHDPEMQAWIREVVRKAAAGEILRSETVNFDAMGKTRVIDFAIKPVLDEQGRVIYLIPEGMDITEYKQTDKQLEQERKLTDAILDSIPGLLYLYDDEWRLVRWNKQHEVLTGYSAEELAGIHVLDFYAGREPDTSRIIAAVSNVMEEGRAEIEADLITKDGRAITFYFTGVRLTIGGKPYFTGIGIDITKNRQAEEELKQEKAFSEKLIDSLPGIFYL
ncbi:MAG: PAS domain-containing protein, partial [Deltaproteobacteria bacterium]|nr:PAS domain-containing protein [Deltaproteobacteria bacterium]